jgi:hypothetical protein
MALMKLGQRKVQSITVQSDPSAVAMLTAWEQAVGTVSRSHPWNCLKKRATLGQLNPALNPQVVPSPTGVPPQAQAWAPSTAYTVNQYVTFGSPAYLYQCLIANTSTNSFAADLTNGWWFQTNYYSPNFIPPGFSGNGTLYGWAYGYQLPSDYVKLYELNGVNCWQGGGIGDLYEIFGKGLYTDAPYADVMYVCVQPDTSYYDPLFTNALVLLLASMTATAIRKDDETLSSRLLAEFHMALQEARSQDSGEAQPRRYNIVSQSRFVRSRRYSTNG